MPKLTIAVKQFKTEEGKAFFKATCKGKYIPSVDVDDETYYTIKLHSPKVNGKSESLDTPTREGFYELKVPSRCDMWLDQREDMLGKNIFHVRASKIVRVDNLEK